MHTANERERERATRRKKSQKALTVSMLDNFRFLVLVHDVFCLCFCCCFAKSCLCARICSLPSLFLSFLFFLHFLIASFDRVTNAIIRCCLTFQLVVFGVPATRLLLLIFFLFCSSFLEIVSFCFVVVVSAAAFLCLEHANSPRSFIHSFVLLYLCFFPCFCLLFHSVWII